MSNNIIYTFEKIDNSLDQKLTVFYNPDGLNFQSFPYFTAIVTSYDGTNYENVETLHGTSVTLYSIKTMLEDGIAVNLFVGLGNKEILPLVKTDSDYAYFSNGNTLLKVDVNGAVTEGETNANK